MIFSLPLEFRGLALNAVPQQGHLFPSNFIKTLHELHIFCPDSYLPPLLGLCFKAYLEQIPLQCNVAKFPCAGFHLEPLRNLEIYHIPF